MATCIESINAVISSGGTGSIPEIFPNTAMSFSVSSSVNNLFLLRSPQFQSVSFTVNLTTNPYNTVFTIFQLIGSTASQVSSINIVDASGFFVADFPAGDYIICVRSGGVNTQNGNFVCRFTGYPQTASFVPSVRVGETFSMVLSGPPTPPKECDEPLYFEILEGALPPGLQMNMLGTIWGTLPNLDCLEDRLSPAVNWYYDEFDGDAWPWGREWRFQVRVWVEGLKDTAFDDEWFCIRIYNNWTYDLNNFLEQAPFQSVHEVRVVEEAPKLPETIECMPCTKIEAPMFVPKEIEPPCPACEQKDQSTIVELIPIPLELCKIAPDDMLVWFDQNRNSDTDNPYIAKFLKDLEESEAFTILRARAGYFQPDPLTPEERERLFVASSRYQNFLQLALVRAEAIDPTSLTAMLKMWRDHENQVLPYTTFSHTGCSMEIDLV